MPPHREVVVEERDLLLGGGGATSSSAAAGGGGGGGAPPHTRSYLVVFTLVASVGGLLFGIDTSVISGALPYLRDDLLQDYSSDAARLAWIQEVIVSAAVVGAGVGAAAGGAAADRLGRKRALLLADVLFAAGAVAMASAISVGPLIAGRVMVGLGVGLASVAVPVYVAEAAPPQTRATLVTANVLAITVGQFLAYVLDYCFSFVPGTWRWMLGVAAVPAVAQFVALLYLPESPKWLASRGMLLEAEKALAKLQPGHTLPHHPASSSGSPGGAAEGGGAGGSSSSSSGGDSSDGGGLGRPGSSLEANESGGGSALGGGSTWRLLRSRTVLRELHLGLGLQVLQQLCGVNTVMYYTPTILELAGFHNKQTALLLSLVPAGTNALGTLVGMWSIDRVGRRPLLLASVAAAALALAGLGGGFYAAERHSPALQAQGSTCLGAAITDCTSCLRHACAFCGGEAPGAALDPGTCLIPNDQAEASCSTAAGLLLYRHGCPSGYTWLILACLIAYLAAFSPGLGPVPWAVNAEIYPIRVRGLATGLAATANWVTNAVVSQTFLTMTQKLGGSGTFWLYSCIAACGFFWTYWFLPETNALTLEQVQQLFEEGPGGGGSRESKRRRSEVPPKPLAA